MVKSYYTEELGNKIGSNQSESRYHVIPITDTKWVVVSDISTRTLRAFPLKKDAVAFARKKAAAKTNGEVVVHALTYRSSDIRVIPVKTARAVG